MTSRLEPNGPGMAAGFFPRPRVMGLCVIFLSLLAFVSGALRNELGLVLPGTIFSVTLIYSFLGVFSLGIVHRGKCRLLSLFVSAETVVVGKEAEVSVRTGGGLPPAKNFFLRLPAILVRCELHLTTGDGRVIRHYLDPAIEDFSSFPVGGRGVYYGNCDSLVIFDAMGFFTLSLPFQQNDNPRLYAIPAPAEEPVSLSLKSSGTEKRDAANYRKSNELTDHRPYIPGDDPRRINWKLYSHAPLGELFVREGEGLPPPHTRLLILIDGEADASLFTPDEARRAVDLLCENGLAAALEFYGRGMEILIGWTGGVILGGNDALRAEDFAVALAWPFAMPLPSAAAGAPSAEPPEGTAALVLALPRLSTNASSLDMFLEKRGHEPAAPVDIVFLYDTKSGRAAELEEAVRDCVMRYKGKEGGE